MDIIWGHHKIGPYLEVVFIHFRAFLKVNVQNGDFLGGC